MTERAVNALPGRRPSKRRLADGCPDQRWFAAKGTTIPAVRIVLRQTLADGPGFGAEHVLVAVEFEARPRRCTRCRWGTDRICPTN